MDTCLSDQVKCECKLGTVGDRCQSFKGDSLLYRFILPKRGNNDNILASVFCILFIMFSLRDNLTLRQIVQTVFQFITYKKIKQN